MRIYAENLRGKQDKGFPLRGSCRRSRLMRRRAVRFELSPRFRAETRSISKAFGLLLFRPLRGHLPLKGKALGTCTIQRLLCVKGAVSRRLTDEGRGALTDSLAAVPKRNCSPTLISLLRCAPQPASPRGSQGVHSAPPYVQKQHLRPAREQCLPGGTGQTNA